MGDLEQLRSAGLFDARVPRYTSFPPVDRFQRGEGKLHHKRWLNTLPHDASLSVYVHVPYCEKMCWFCACRTQAVTSATAVESYLDAVLREIRLVRRELPDKVSLSRLYLGGGTPTLLSPDQMHRLLDTIYRAFPRTKDFECAVEVDTTQLPPVLIPALIGQGMTCATVGVQDFSSQVQAAIGRQQSFEQIRNVVRHLRDSGLQRLDMEMLFGLPHQTAATVAETTQQLLALEPDRVAICEYTHMPHVAKRQMLLDTRRLPDAQQAFQMFQVARRIMLTDGYVEIGMDHFVRPHDGLAIARDENRLRRDFQGYSDNPAQATIGFGASAVSQFPQGFVQNVPATSVYMTSLRAGVLPAHRGHRLSSSDLLVACMIEMLMCRFRIDRDEIERRFPGSAVIVDSMIETIGNTFGPYVEIAPRTLVVKSSAHPLTRQIARLLDEASEAHPAARHGAI